MPSLISRVLGLLALVGSYFCYRWIIAVWHWIQENGHTEGSPAGLGIFAIGVGVDLFLIAIGASLAIFGLLGLLFPWKALGRNKRSD